MKDADYVKRAKEFAVLCSAAVEQGRVDDMALARKLESIARKVRRNDERCDRPWIDGKSKYGRVCNANRKLYRQDVNEMYWMFDMSIAAIARKLGISAISVTNLIEKKEKYVDDPSKASGERVECATGGD